MKKLTTQNLHSVLNEHIGEADFVSVLNALIRFLRAGGRKNAAARFDHILHTFKQDEALCRRFSERFYRWMTQIHVYPALIKLGIFSRNSFGREMIDRIYERFSPSYKDLNNLLEVFLYLFNSQYDDRWLSTISLRQWLNFYELIQRHTAEPVLQTASRQLSESRIRAIEILAIWVASEALQPEFIRLAPKLLEADSAFVGLQRETAKLVEYYRDGGQSYDTAHLEVMFDQCHTQVVYLRRRGTGAGSGSSIQVAHLLERLQQTLGRLKLLIDLQTQQENSNRLVIKLMNSMIYAAVEQYSTQHLRKSSIRMLTRSITENTSNHGEHYITRNRKEYLNMLYSAAGGGVVIALMALHKIHITGLGLGEFATAFLSGLNYGLGFMLIHILHFTVATKQPAMTAASFAEQVELNERGRAVDNKLAKLLIDVCRSQSVAVFGNVGVAVLLAGIIAASYALQTGHPLLDAESTAYQFKSIDVFTQPTLWYAAIAGVWLFCSGIIAGFFDNRADYLDLRRRLTINPLLRRLLPAKARSRFAVYLHQHYGSLMGNFIFGMLLGLTGFFGHLLDLPLDIRHVAFSSANLGYAAISGEVGVIAFMYGMFGVLAIGTANLLVSFTLALFVALRSRGTRLGSLSNILKSIWLQVKTNPLQLVYPPQPEKAEDKNPGEQKPQ
ncbi:site-specific recombinase [Bergeriella denitrificans]|uniref:Site-specific recombinase n=2 Tax=Bergeriella denitrificans TaxID=494 RepID=A0A378UHT3_BERDE|nr:site-specific recombinase [Bergeriella denitrificans]